MPIVPSKPTGGVIAAPTVTVSIVPGVAPFVLAPSVPPTPAVCPTFSPNSFFVWGTGFNGAPLGLGMSGGVEVMTLSDANGAWTSANTGRGTFTYWLHSSGALYGSGNNSQGALGVLTNPTLTQTQIESATNWVATSAGNLHGYFLDDQCLLYGVGDNANAELGQGSTGSPSTTIIPIDAPNKYKSIAASDRSGHFVSIDGTLWGVGYNFNGQLGQGNTTSPITSLIQIGVASNWVKVSGYRNFVYVINDLGELWGVGSNADGALGQGDQNNRDLLVQISTGPNWVDISVGNVHGYFINDLGELWGAGRNFEGQLGQGVQTIREINPVQLGSATNWVRCYAGTNHGVFLNSLGELWGVGQNGGGELGQNNTTSPVLSLVQIGADTDWQDATGGSTGTIGLKLTGI